MSWKLCLLLTFWQEKLVASHSLKASPTCRSCKSTHAQPSFKSISIYDCRPHTDTFLVVQESHEHPGTPDCYMHLSYFALPCTNASSLSWTVSRQAPPLWLATRLVLEVLCNLHDHFGMIADNRLKPLIEELTLLPNKTSYRSLRTCDLEMELTHENKGIESIQFYDAGEKGTPKCCSNSTLPQHCWLG